MGGEEVDWGVASEEEATGVSAVASGSQEGASVPAVPSVEPCLKDYHTVEDFGLGKQLADFMWVDVNSMYKLIPLLKAAWKHIATTQCRAPTAPNKNSNHKNHNSIFLLRRAYYNYDDPGCHLETQRHRGSCCLLV